MKKAEHRRIDAFKLWSWRRLLRVPWTAKRSNQSILKEISPEYSLEGLMLKLMRRADSLEKTLMMGKTETGGEGDDRGWVIGWHHWLNGHEFEKTLGDGEGQGSPVCCSPKGHKESDITEQLRDRSHTPRLCSHWDRNSLPVEEEAEFPTLFKWFTFLSISFSAPLMPDAYNDFICNVYPVP